MRTVQNDISGEIYMTKDILVRVRGVQTIGEEEDTVEMITPGTYYVKNGKQYLIYDESLDETGTPTHNLSLIHISRRSIRSSREQRTM